MLKNLWEKWKVIAEKIGNFQASVIFSILYFILITPLGITTSLFRDFLGRRCFPTWQEYGVKAGDIYKLRQQF